MLLLTRTTWRNVVGGWGGWGFDLTDRFVIIVAAPFRCLGTMQWVSSDGYYIIDLCYSREGELFEQCGMGKDLITDCF